mmetsp:Transcript_24600/g.62493  ORF Transcript_24600/g.62493 Transcript_24600/m.62493 type:complete len:229 (-) Transcript_24600:1578-2264(-)
MCAGTTAASPPAPQCFLPPAAAVAAAAALRPDPSVGMRRVGSDADPPPPPPRCSRRRRRVSSCRAFSCASPASRRRALPSASSKSIAPSSLSALTDDHDENSLTSTSTLPLGSTAVHSPRSTAGSARFLSGDPTTSPCTRRLSLSLAPASLRMTSGAGCRSSPSDTSRMSLLAHLASVSRSRQRFTGSLKSDPPLNTFSRKSSRLLTDFMSLFSSSSRTSAGPLNANT